MKKTILPLSLLVVGLAIGYFIGHKNSGNLIDREKAIRAEIIKSINESLPQLQGSRKSQEITETLARFMMKDFRAQNEKSPTPLLTINKKPMEGFYINLDPIRNIVNDSRAFDGLSFYFGTNPDAVNETGNFYTLLFTGAKWKTIKRDKMTDTTILVNEGPIYDYIDPCPTVCGSLTPTRP